MTPFAGLLIAAAAGWTAAILLSVFSAHQRGGVVATSIVSAAAGAVCTAASDAAADCEPPAWLRESASASEAIRRFRYSVSRPGSLGFGCHWLESLFGPVNASRMPFWLTNT